MIQIAHTRILLGVAGLLALGTVSAVAGEARHLTRATLESGSHSVAATTVAGAHGSGRSNSLGVEAQADVAVQRADISADAGVEARHHDRDGRVGTKANVKNDRDTHGDFVTAVATNHAAAGGRNRNHGGAVSAAAGMHTTGDEDASMSAVFVAELALRSR